MFDSSAVAPTFFAAFPGLNPIELIIVGGWTLGFCAVIGAIFYTAVKVARLKPMDVCPHCGANLRKH